MSVTVTIRAVTQRRKVIALLVAFLMLVLLSATVVLVHWDWAEPLSEQEKELIGTWECKWNGSATAAAGLAPGRRIFYEFKTDRNCEIRVIDAKSGDTCNRITDLKWCWNGQKLIMNHTGIASRPTWDVLHTQPRYEGGEIVILTPDSFQHDGTVEVYAKSLKATVTGTLSRVGAQSHD